MGEIYTTPRRVWELENKVKKDLKDGRYIPKITFPGYTECYTSLQEVMTSLKKYMFRKF